ncbi:MAG: efflux RND transporter permease subunit [Flavobacteriales bacterium]|nr:efflux RND transporter permease subunit [Flavobacteriales bacterium]MCB9174247.1 efflux RND transporter permease subunit [Flavobacteriales bacterium]
MRNLISYFIQNPIWANAIIIITVVFGAISIANMDSSFFPEQDPNRIGISVFYNGASPIEMEEGVTIKIEQALQGIAGIEEIFSSSSENFATVNIVAYKDVDLDEVLRDVENAVDGINSFPDGAEKPTVVKQRGFMNSRASFISLSGNVDIIKLKETAEKIEDDLLNTDAISQVLKDGYPATEFSIEVEEEQLLRYNLKFDDVANAIRFNNRDVSAGSVKTDGEEFLIRAKAKQNTELGIEDLVVRTLPKGEVIRIGDIAKVKYQFADSPIKSFVNGKRNITLTIMKLEDEDLGKISKEVKRYVEEFNAKNEDMELTIMFQFYDMLKQRIDMLLNNGLMGLLLVLIVLGLFLNLRLSIWVAAGIPISFLGMFIFGFFYGITINMISLFGMILVVGIVVDDGIVIAENIYAHYERGKSPLDATIDGTMEVISSVFTSVLTTVVAFSVLMFIEGMEQMKEMAFVVIASLLFSMIEAFLVLPSHLKSKRLQQQDKKLNWFGKLKLKVEKGIAYIRDRVYGATLKSIIYKKRLRRILVFFPLLFMIIIGGLMGAGIIQSTFFPAIPFDDFKVEFAYKSGEPKEKTTEFMWYCYEKVMEVKYELEEEYGDTLITYVSAVVGGTEELGESGSHAGMVRVNLDVEGAEISSFEIAKRVEDKITKDPSLEKFMIGGGNRWGKPVEIALNGDNYRSIKEAKDYLKQELTRMPELKDVTDNGGQGNREILLKLTEKARLLGLTHLDITKQIRQGFFGEEVQRLIVGTEEVKVWVRYPEEDRVSMGQLDNVRIKTMTGQLIPLKELVEYEIERGEVSIKHFDGVREIRVEAAQVDAYASTSDINNKIKEDIIPKLYANYPDVKAEFRGQAEEAQKSGSSMAIIGGVLVMLMLLILSLNFNSVWQGILFFPLILSAPFYAILGHGMEHQPFSLLSVWGVIALIGVLVNDAIVFLDKYNRNLKEGMSVNDAVLDAGTSRFRAILLTSITTIAGLYPLILEPSFQAQFLVPMAISVAYGVLFGTMFILLFFPLLILLFNDTRRAFKWLWTGDKPTPEEVEPTIIDIRRKQDLE